MFFLGKSNFYLNRVKERAIPKKEHIREKKNLMCPKLKKNIFIFISSDSNNKNDKEIKMWRIRFCCSTSYRNSAISSTVTEIPIATMSKIAICYLFVFN